MVGDALTAVVELFRFDRARNRRGRARVRCGRHRRHGASAGVNWIESKLPTTVPAVSTTSRRICVPAPSVTALVTFCQFCHPPVAGTVNGARDVRAVHLQMKDSSLA